MWKAGLLVGIVLLVLSAGSGMVAPVCVPCLALAVGLLPGYLAGLWERPEATSAAARVGAAAGAIAGVGVTLGQLVAGVLNWALFDPQVVSDLYEQFGLADVAVDAAVIRFGIAVGSCCFGLNDLILMAGMGALGGLVWLQTGCRPGEAADGSGAARADGAGNFV